jgi:hypothetical protein
MSLTAPSTVPHIEPGVFGPDRLDDLDAYFRQHGYAILRGAFDDAFMDTMQTECAAAQAGVIDGSLDPKHGTIAFNDDAAGAAFVNYVSFAEQVSPAVLGAITDRTVVGLMRRWLGDGCWVLGSDSFGVIFQDARAGRESNYTRIGWHSDWQSGPHLDIWPSVAFTIHIDATSPANGFLRVVPGSHRWATPAPFENVNGAVVPPGSRPAGGHTDEPPPFAMPLRFEKVPGEIAVYAERGDVLFHDAYLWHSAARATDDGGIRRHVRGGFYSGTPAGTAEDFVKNAAR